MSNLKYLLLLISLSLIACQAENKNKDANAHKTIKQVTLNVNGTNNSLFKNMPRKPDSAFNITIDEMDKMLLCTKVVQESLKKHEKEIEEVEKRLNYTDPLRKNRVTDKVGTDIFEKCTKSIDIKLVNKYIRNLTYFNNFKWEECYDEYNKIDFDKYMGEEDLNYTVSQNLLMYRYDKVTEIYQQKRIEERHNIYNENKKIKIGNFEINNIPLPFKLGFFLIILLLFFGTIFYFLKSLGKKPVEKKKKEKKKKVQ